MTIGGVKNAKQPNQAQIIRIPNNMSQIKTVKQTSDNKTQVPLNRVMKGLIQKRSQLEINAQET